ncbi:MAG: hypothetical protein V5A29_18030 [Haloarculaceae archaeon]
MPELEGGTREREAPSGSNGTGRAGSESGRAGSGRPLEVAGADVSVSGDPTDPEAAALAAVLAEHLRAEAQAAGEAEAPRYAVDPWCLAGRLGLRSPCDVPATCRSGREWKMAGRVANR